MARKALQRASCYMTHADVPFEEKQELHITDKMVRLSIGIENYNDLIWDIEQALEKVTHPTSRRDR